MHSERHFFQGSEGHRLAGRLDLPESEEPRAWALFAHCFTCTKNLKSAYHLSEALTETGIGVLRFDFTGLGESEGDFSETTFSSNVEDLRAAARSLDTAARSPQILIGHSLGGAAILKAAPSIVSCTAVATIAAPADPTHLSDILLEEGERPEGDVEVRIGGRPFSLRRSFFEDLRRHSLETDLARLGRALLILHSPRDAVVGIDHATRLFKAARHSKSFVSLDSADHLLSIPSDARYAGRVIASWAERYLAAEKK